MDVRRLVNRVSSPIRPAIDRGLAMAWHAAVAWWKTVPLPALVSTGILTALVAVVGVRKLAGAASAHLDDQSFAGVLLAMLGATALSRLTSPVLGCNSSDRRADDPARLIDALVRCLPVLGLLAFAMAAGSAYQCGLGLGGALLVAGGPWLIDWMAWRVDSAVMRSATRDLSAEKIRTARSTAGAGDGGDDVAEKRAPAPLNSESADEYVEAESAAESELDDGCWQWVRRQRAPGRDVLEGAATVEFRSGQRQADLHLAFCPAFEQLPRIEAHLLNGDEARGKVGALFRHGMRLEVRRSGRDLPAAAVRVFFTAASGDADESAAA